MLRKEIDFYIFSERSDFRATWKMSHGPIWRINLTSHLPLQMCFMAIGHSNHFLFFVPLFFFFSQNVISRSDLVGPAKDYELHARWIQWGAFSGVFRTHDRGMAAGSCNDDNPPDCAIVEIWKSKKKLWNKIIFLYFTFHLFYSFHFI